MIDMDQCMSLAKKVEFRAAVMSREYATVMLEGI